MRKSREDSIFGAFTIAVVVVIALACLLPFLYIVSMSFSGKNAVLRNEVFLWPVDFDLTAYKAVFNNQSLSRSMWFSMWLTVVYTLVSLIITVLCAYPLSRTHLQFKKPLLVYIIITMYFSGGMIPVFLNIRDLGLLDNFWALVLPSCLSTYNMILMRSFFAAMPKEMEESAFVDGANDLTVLTRIILPLSKASIATVGLFYAVSRWNGFMDSLLYINTESMYTIQVRLRQLIQSSQVTALMEDIPEFKTSLISETIKAACLVFSMIPVMLMYPWLQRYFVKGTMIGSLKG
ncbi:MAG: carbohydrate ABC transporter permease [Oscillospiraceae bacterium]|jgi:putative aldouronate transport system permease protein|nr:carbohydrate ABC transporter permease [Oscillospiraceae bacterium]